MKGKKTLIIMVLMSLMLMTFASAYTCEAPSGRVGIMVCIEGYSPCNNCEYNGCYGVFSSVVETEEACNSLLDPEPIEVIIPEPEPEPVVEMLQNFEGEELDVEERLRVQVKVLNAYSSEKDDMIDATSNFRNEYQFRSEGIVVEKLITENENYQNHYVVTSDRKEKLMFFNFEYQEQYLIDAEGAVKEYKMPWWSRLLFENSLDEVKENV